MPGVIRGNHFYGNLGAAIVAPQDADLEIIDNVMSRNGQGIVFLPTGFNPAALGLKPNAPNDLVQAVIQAGRASTSVREAEKKISLIPLIRNFLLYGASMATIAQLVMDLLSKP